MGHVQAYLKTLILNTFCLLMQGPKSPNNYWKGPLPSSCINTNKPKITPQAPRVMTEVEEIA